MDRETTIKKNLDLHAEWARYLFEHPEAMDQIPEGAQVVIVPTDDAELARENTHILTEARSRGIPVVVVHMAFPKPMIPHIEVLSH